MVYSPDDHDTLENALDSDEVAQGEEQVIEDSSPVSKEDSPSPNSGEKVTMFVDEDEDSASIRKHVFELAIPALVEQILLTLISMVDMIMVGRLGPWAITSVGLSNQPMMLAMAVFIAINVGATALVARFVGAGDAKEASNVARQSLMIAVSMGVVLMILGLIFAPNILLFMGAEHDVIGPGTQYLRIVCLSIPMWAVSISLTAALRGAGDTRTPMVVNITANLVNILFNYLLIFGNLGFPRMEVAGAAAATSLSRLVACILMLSRVFKGDKIIKITIHDSFAFDSEIIKRILNIGVPAALEQLVLRTGQMAFAKIVSSFGTVTYAAHQVALNIEGLSFAPGTAFQIASTTLVGQSLGAKNPDKAERIGWETAKVGALVGVFVGVIYFFFGGYIAYLYTDDLTVIHLAETALKLIAISQPFMISQFTFTGALRGAGDVKWTLIITMAGFWGIRVLTAYILAIRLNLGLMGAWIGMALDMIVRCILAAMRFRTGHWKYIRV
ncbi:MAG TPA: MATE family efflux transporter [Bacillota bacterium]|nr:MATE family efflux transporter [Bacillota bacterium]HOK65003.1 MATE family efflux transporter [Bacillota bacterium]HOL11797.1 MATE family efflux transporter [Bacillota bacterium]HOQ02289.1 MATE family efflux transporter [Bacillota bacterium]HPP61483.1 MATE family efflux transporter [Bacillota bacterium]